MSDMTLFTRGQRETARGKALTVLLTLVAACLALSFDPADTFLTLFGSLNKPGLLFPAVTSQHWTQFGPIDKTSAKPQTFGFINTTRVDKAAGTIIETITADTYQAETVMALSLRYKSGFLRITDSDSIRKSKFDNLVFSYDPIRNELVSRYLLLGKVTQEKRVPYSITNIDLDTLAVTLQALLLSGNGKSFTTGLVLKNMDVVVPVLLSYSQATDLTKVFAKYKMPPAALTALKKLSGATDVFHIYTVVLTGIEKLFYPYKSYLIFRKNLTVDFVASIRDKPDDPVVQLVDANQ